MKQFLHYLTSPLWIGLIAIHWLIAGIAWLFWAAGALIHDWTL